MYDQLPKHYKPTSFASLEFSYLPLAVKAFINFITLDDAGARILIVGVLQLKSVNP
jgi:hypothetical protein